MVEVAGCPDCKGVQGTDMREDGIADMVAACGFRSVDLNDWIRDEGRERRDDQPEESLPISAWASGAFGERSRDNRITFPQVANPYLLSLRIETP